LLYNTDMKYTILIWLLLILFFGTYVPNQAFAADPANLVIHLFDINKAPSAKAVAISPDGKEIWATLLLNKHRGLSIFSALDGTEVGSIDLRGGGGVEIVFSKNGDKAYVSQMETAQVFEIDVATKKIVRTLKTGSTWTKFLELSPDGTKLYASNWVGNNVSEFDLASGKLIRNIKTVTTPRGIYVTADGNYLYVAGFDKGEIQKINLKNNTRKTIFKSGGAMRHFAADNDAQILFASDMGMNVIWKLNLKTDKVEHFAKTDKNPNTIVLSPDKKVLFVSNRGKNYTPSNYYVPGPEWGSVLLFDTGSAKLLDAIVAGNQPTALDVSRDGTLLAFSDFLDSRIEIFKIPTYDELLKGNGGRSTVYKKELQKKKVQK
jgi:DNA-binding beta-propeller fold protein YncE